MLTLKDKAQLSGVWVLAKNHVYLRATIKALENEMMDHVAMLHFDGMNWSQYMIPAAGVSHCAISERGRTVLTLSPDGTVHIARPDGFSWEKIDIAKDGPSSLCQMRDIRPIENQVFAVGMKYMVYRRSSGGVWARSDEGIRINQPKVDFGGFLSIDGCAENHIYAVGFKGEICRFDGRRWSHIDSPTNLKVERVRVISTDLAVTCGAAGTIMIGQGDRWRVISQNLTRSTLWGLEYFGGKFYFSDTEQIYVFDGSQLSIVDLHEFQPLTTARLHAADGVLWSVGEKDVLMFDGITWSRQAGF